MIQNKYTEICCISIHLYWTIRKRNQENNPICNDIKKNKTPRNKFNQNDERLVFWKLQDSDERNWRQHK